MVSSWGVIGGIASSLADGLQHRGVERLAHRGAAPHHHLQRRVDAVAFHERSLYQILKLLDRGAGQAAQRNGVAEHHRALLGHEVEVAEPEPRSEEHTSELQSLMRISYAVLCLQNTT